MSVCSEIKIKVLPSSSTIGHFYGSNFIQDLS